MFWIFFIFEFEKNSKVIFKAGIWIRKKLAPESLDLVIACW